MTVRITRRDFFNGVVIGAEASVLPPVGLIGGMDRWALKGVR